MKKMSIYLFALSLIIAAGCNNKNNQMQDRSTDQERMQENDQMNERQLRQPMQDDEKKQEFSTEEKSDQPGRGDHCFCN